MPFENLEAQWRKQTAAADRDLDVPEAVSKFRKTSLQVTLPSYIYQAQSALGTVGYKSIAQQK